jgi:hypothetical protein
MTRAAWVWITIAAGFFAFAAFTEFTQWAG